MINKIYKVIEKTGIHARPATSLVQAASKFDAEVKLMHNGKLVNLKSIMGVMSCGIKYGDEIEIIVDGYDEVQALEHLQETLIRESLAE
jgi:phosphocarrier protein